MKRVFGYSLVIVSFALLTFFAVGCGEQMNEPLTTEQQVLLAPTWHMTPDAIEAVDVLELGPGFADQYDLLDDVMELIPAINIESNTALMVPVVTVNGSEELIPADMVIHLSDGMIYLAFEGDTDENALKAFEEELDALVYDKYPYVIKMTSIFHFTESSGHRLEIGYGDSVTVADMIGILAGIVDSIYGLGKDAAIRAVVDFDRDGDVDSADAWGILQACIAW